MKAEITNARNVQPWDDIEVHGCRDIDGKGTIEQDDDNPQFFSVYLHYIGAGLEWVSDHKIKEEADRFASMLLSIARNYKPE